MDFYELRAGTIIAKFDDARAEKMKKNQTSTIQISFNFSQNVDNRQSDLSKENMGSPNI